MQLQEDQMLETVSGFCFSSVEVHFHICMTVLSPIYANFLLFYSFAAIVIVLLLESIVMNLVPAKVASTDLSMKIQFLRHVNKLNRVIH